MRPFLLVLAVVAAIGCTSNGESEPPPPTPNASPVATPRVLRLPGGQIDAGEWNEATARIIRADPSVCNEVSVLDDAGVTEMFIRGLRVDPSAGSSLVTGPGSVAADVATAAGTVRTQCRSMGR
jgi:hypothetical protein